MGVRDDPRMTRRWTKLAAVGLTNLTHRVRRLAEAPTDRAAETLRIDLELYYGPGHATSGRRAERLTRQDCVSLIRREVDELTPLAEHLYEMIDLIEHEQEVTEEAFVRLDDLRWLLGNYVIKGGRIRRLIALPDLLVSIDLLDPAGRRQRRPSLAPFKYAADELLQRIRDTNVATVDWLMAHRVALPDPDYLDSNALLGRFDRLEVEPSSISADPLYLLTCHIHDFLETMESSGDVEHPVLDTLEAQLGRILATIESEITATQAFNAALLSLAREMRSADAA